MEEKALKNPAVRAGPAFAGDFLDDVMLALRQIVRIVEMLDALRSVGPDDAQLVAARCHLLRFAADVASSALEPPEHDRLPFKVRLEPDTPSFKSGYTRTPRTSCMSV
jgi:hypothetical protein